MPQNKTIQPATPSAAAPNADASPKTATGEIGSKPTSPTLVEFHSKNAAVPEWRLQLQNVVRQRQERASSETEIEIKPTAQRAQLMTSGATALKAETIGEPIIVRHKNPTLNSALERIEKARRQFLADDEEPSPPPPHALVSSPVKASKNYPFYIAAKTNDAAPKPAESNDSVNSFAKPKLAAPALRTKEDKLDTNKLPALPASVATNFESRPNVADDAKPPSEEPKEFASEVIEVVKSDPPKTDVKVREIAEVAAPEEVEEYDDLAPFSMRFNAGLFDLIIGSFASLLLLSPFMFLGGDWFSVAGLFAFLAACAIVMFIYLTASVGFYGKTFGMRLFSIEIVDFESEDYPTFHQAAVSSAVYLLSLALGGIGFLSVPFNEDKRAVHDLVSGTIIVKE